MMYFVYGYLAIALYQLIDVSGSGKIKEYMSTLDSFLSKVILVAVMIGTSLIWPIFLFERKK